MEPSIVPDKRGRFYTYQMHSATDVYAAVTNRLQM
jgi:hypothetical protein